MKLVISTQTNSIAGMTSDENYNVTGYVLADAPEGFDETHINDYTLVDGVLTIDPTAALQRAKLQKIRAIRTHFDGIVTGLKAGVAAYEVATWDTQRTEYTAWSIDPTVKTPYVSSLALARNEALDVLMGKVGVRVQALATLQGTQQRLEKEAEAATDMATVNAITY